jgi:Xaa-Pro aminopeptidase
MTDRLKKLQAEIRGRRVGAFLVTNLHNIRYLVGYSGSNGLLMVHSGEALFLTDFRYQEQAREEVRGCQTRISARDLFEDLPEVPQARRVRRLGFEPESLTYAQFSRLRKKLRHARWIPLARPVEQFRRIKDREELHLIRRAAAIADRAFKESLPLVQPGVRERDLAAELDYRLRRLGATAPAFETIVASGPRSALPHATPTSRRIRKGDFIVFDLGAQFGGYCSDMTRTVLVGKPTARHREVYELVLRAQAAALKAARAGVKAALVDRAARQIIEQAGYGKNFGHALGHGVGLEVHELPGLSSRSENTLEKDEVVTIEPGVYVPGWGGVRIEDLVRVTKGGCEILTSTTKRLVVV